MNVTAFKRRKEFGKTLASDIAHRMRNEVVTCRLKPGEVLKFDALRLAYGASFTTLREALTCLAAEGLVVAEEQRGFKVAPISLSDLIDLTRARILIDVDLIRRSIENGDDDWEIAVISSIHRLGIIEGRAVEDYADNPEWKLAHREFHESLVAACGSPTLLGIRQSLFERAERYRNISARFRPRPRDKAGEHRALMKAAVGRDADRACELIARHIQNTTDNVIKYASELFSQN
ncbi:GntR family transcriptional regulator [Bradyrhizobium sp. AUGA SZCCT0431]|uniref:GntR family transcriptional regulator n=1 Tax=Bradyrhizobium sp. AUGA SZCCT0431 TaxID=2807674 RepID=UPI001BA69780|nr:FCD domain-containing protein [Bradyrhizobium sp. AUGA SZCCT0431]MBR1145779.1 FCD domain-containing protein [Bradyrhizobium sp. AUGA SZCCT0431]